MHKFSRGGANVLEARSKIENQKIEMNENSDEKMKYVTHHVM